MMMSSNDVDHHKVPIWIGTDCKLVSGINKSTTCQNVIQSLVRTENPSKFVIVEKWKKMERRLDPNVRILKVWKAWGDQKDDVALILRHHHSTDGYIDKRISNKVLRRNKSSQHHKLSNHDENMEEVEVTEPMERLLKLVLTQGETIQVQLKKLRHQEEQIERYEEQMHRIRSLQEGENYVVDSYLRDEKGKKSSRKRDKSPRKSGWLKQQQQAPHHSHQHQHSRHPHPSQRNNKDRDSGGGSGGGGGVSGGGGGGGGGAEKVESSQSTPPEVQMRSNNVEDKCDSGVEENIHEKSDLMERICDLNGKLTKEEEHLVKLGLKIKKYYERYKGAGAGAGGGGSSGGQFSGGKSSSDQGPHLCSEDRYCDPGEEYGFEGNTLRPEDDEEMREMMSQLEALRDITSGQFSEIDINEKSLNELEQLLDSKHDHVAHLTYQIQLVDEESEHLRQRLLKISQGFPPHPHHYPPTHTNNTNNNNNTNTNQTIHQHPAHLHAHPHLTPILTSSPVPFTASPQGQHHHQHQHPPLKTPLSSLATNNLCSSHPSPVSSAAVALPSGLTIHPAPISMSPASVGVPGVGLGGGTFSDGDKMTPHMNPILPPNTNNNSSSSNSGSNSNSSCNNNKSNPSSLAVETAAAITFGCQHSESIPATQLNLHIKPCRDHQDNDSNSDTGISSLHSSSDENTLFVLDTLV